MLLANDPTLRAERNGNLCRYVHNNPINFIDPSGLVARKWRSTDGKQSFAGEFIKLTGNLRLNEDDSFGYTVDIRGENGRTYKLPLTDLHESDQRYIKGIAPIEIVGVKEGKEEKVVETVLAGAIKREGVEGGLGNISFKDTKFTKRISHLALPGGGARIKVVDLYEAGIAIELAGIVKGVRLTETDLQDTRRHERVHAEHYQRIINTVLIAEAELNKRIALFPAEKQLALASALAAQFTRETNSFLELILPLEAARQDFHLDHFDEKTPQISGGRICAIGPTYKEEFSKSYKKLYSHPGTAWFLKPKVHNSAEDVQAAIADMKAELYGRYTDYIKSTMKTLDGVIEKINNAEKAVR